MTPNGSHGLGPNLLRLIQSYLDTSVGRALARVAGNVWSSLAVSPAGTEVPLQGYCFSRLTLDYRKSNCTTSEKEVSLSALSGWLSPCVFLSACVWLSICLSVLYLDAYMSMSVVP